MSRPIQIQKPLLGSAVVSYGCPHCDAHLKSRVEEIGSADFCPDCNRQFVVPGAYEWQAVLEEQNAAAAAKAAEREAAKEAAIEVERQAKRLKQEREEAARALIQEAERLPVPGAPPLLQPNRQQVVVAQLVQPQATMPNQTRQCPFCSEEILATAIKCKHCGEFLDGRPRQAASQPVPVYYQQPTKGDSGCGLIVTIAFGIVLAAIILMFL